MLSPNEKAELESSRAHVPQYLFRAFGSGSSGHNSRRGFFPPAHVRGISHTSILDIPYQDNKHMLEQHFLWNYKSVSEYSSWSSSLLWVLQHAVRKRDHRREFNASICVFNTRIVSHEIYPARTLLRLYRIPSQGKLRHDYYDGEYLVHGALEQKEECFDVVTLDLLIENGLYKYFREFDDPTHVSKLYYRVVDLRRAFFFQPEPINDRQLDAMKRLAMSFSSNWHFTMTVAFLSLLRREYRDDANFRIIMDELDKYNHPICHRVSSNDLRSFSQGLEEVSQFIEMFQAIYEARKREDAARLQIVRTPAVKPPAGQDDMTTQLQALSRTFHSFLVKAANDVWV